MGRHLGLREKLLRPGIGLAWALLCRHQDNLAAVCDILGAGRSWQVDSIKMDNMDNKRMTGELMQLLSMFLQVEHLDLSFLSLAHLEAEVLAEVTCQVEEVRLTGTDLTTSQLQLLLTSISEDSKLRSLDIGENHIEAVDPNLLAQVRHLTSADLSFCQVTTAQMTSLLTAICQDSRLLHLSLSGCNLASVALRPTGCRVVSSLSWRPSCSAGRCSSSWRPLCSLSFRPSYRVVSSLIFFISSRFFFFF